MKKNNFLVLTLLLGAGLLYSQESETRYEIWESASAEMEVVSDVVVSLEGAMRHRTGANSRIDVVFGELAIGYQGLNWVVPRIYYRYSDDLEEETRQRIGGLVDFPLKLSKRWRVTPRFRYDLDNDGEESAGKVRLRVKPQWRKQDWRVFTSFEFFIPDEESLDKIRYRLGTSYRFNKHHRLQLSLALEDRVEESRKDVGIIALDYRYRL